jgi:hypothetical protein
VCSVAYVVSVVSVSILKKNFRGSDDAYYLQHLLQPGTSQHLHK